MVNPMKNYTAVLVALSVLAATSSYADTVVVTADRMVDVIAGRVVDRPQITITDGRIISVASQGAPSRGCAPRRPCGNDTASGPDRHARASHVRSAPQRLQAS